MGYQERLLEKITLTAPDGTVFTAKWRSSTDPEEKTQNQFKTVGGNRGRVQDGGLGLRTHSFDLYFEGDDNDIDSETFIAALSQYGAWTVQHPVLGLLSNQYPISFSPAVDPTESGNVTIVATSWVTDYPDDKATSAIQKATEVQEAVKNLNEKSTKDFFDRVRTGTANLNNKIKNVSDTVVSSIDDAFYDILSVIDGANATITTLENGITSTVGSIAGNTQEFSAQIQELCQKPAELMNTVDESIATMKSAYNTVFSNLTEVDLTGSNEEQQNQAQTTQMATLATVGGLALSVIGANGIQTRSQAIDLEQFLIELFNSLIDTLDGYSDTIALEAVENLVTEKYFSQTESYDALRMLLASLLSYLSLITISLKKERTITIKKPMPAVFVCLEYYDSEDMDLLIDSNNLSLDEIMLLPAGKELKIYV